MYISHKNLKTKYVSKLDRKRAPKKIFVGKGQLKHTGTKVIITIYIYNTEKVSLIREYKRLYLSLFSQKKKYILIRKGNEVITYLKKPLEKQIVLGEKYSKDLRETIIFNRPYTVEEFLNKPKYITTIISKIYYNSSNINETFSSTSNFKQITYYDLYFSIVGLYIENISSYLNILNKYFEYLTKLVQIKILTKYEKFLIYINIVNTFYIYNYPDYEYYKKIAERKYLKDLYRLRYLLKFNSVKFEKQIGRAHV